MDEALHPGTTLGPYEIEALIGSGGMGRVYRAVDPRLGRRVAIKTLAPAATADADLARRFESEVRIVGGLDHPNLLVVYDVGQSPSGPFLVSELLEGETLRSRLARDGALPERQAIDVATQVARGLAAAHARGIVHRDLKPENLFLTRDGRVKILDFGIAKHVQVPGATTVGGRVSQGLTATGSILGTVGYMAPEQVLGESLDARADLFALGVVLHEMLAGAAPFRRETAIATLSAIVTEESPPLPTTVAPLLAQVVERCLAKAREDRFQSAHDVGVALELCTTGTMRRPAAGIARGVPAPGGMSRRRAIAIGAASALAGAAAGAGAMLARHDPPASPSFRRLTFRRGLIRSARVGPDGQSIVVGALWGEDPCRVYTGRIDVPETGALDLPEANVLAVSRTGELALALGAHRDGVITYGTLARVPITGGTPRQLVGDVNFADWSPDGTELAIVRLVEGRNRLEYPIGTVLVAPPTGEATGLGFPRVSPDGQRVAYVQYAAPGSLSGRICVVDRAGKVTPLTEQFLNVHGLAWRGDEVWFTASEDRPLFRALRAVSPGRAARTVARIPSNMTLWDAFPDGRLLIAQTDDRAVLVSRTAGVDHDRDLSWLDASWIADLSRDGRSILFTETGLGGGPVGSAYLRGVDGSPAVRLTAGTALALSPDGRTALCMPDSVTFGSRSPELLLVPTGAGETRRIPGNGLSFIDARWLPDADHVVVEALERGHGSRLHRLDLRSGTATPFTPEGVGGWVISPDGATAAITSREPGIQLYPTIGGTPRALPGPPVDGWLLGWVREGLLVTRDGSGAGVGDVRLIDVTTGAERAWADIRPQDPAGVMALVSFRVTPDGTSSAYTWHRALNTLYLADGLA